MINVEYNQLDPLLRATGYPDGDANSETGYSPFPGNINQVIFWPDFHLSLSLSPPPVPLPEKKLCFLTITSFIKIPATSSERGVYI